MMLRPAIFLRRLFWPPSRTQANSLVIRDGIEPDSSLTDAYGRRFGHETLIVGNGHPNFQLRHAWYAL